MSIPIGLQILDGDWEGKNRLWLTPDEPVRVSEAAASIKQIAQGKFLRIDYTWIEEKPQSGSLLIGQTDQDGLVQVTWIDSWHMGDQSMICSGKADAEGFLSVLGSYAAPPGPDWGWRIAIDPGDGESFILRMYNRTPDGQEYLAVEVDFYRQAKVEILPYQNSWPDEFGVIASVLRRGLGDLALRIDHIGSTSVPGLPAKDVIDVQITVAALDQRLLSAMQALGYTQPEGIWRDHRPAQMEGPETDWEKWLFRPPAGQRRTHTHVRVQGRANQRYPLLFRDYLRAHPATAQSYAELKRRLAENLADSRTYPGVKDPAVDLIYKAAEEWAVTIGWQLGPSDA